MKEPDPTYRLALELETDRIEGRGRGKREMRIVCQQRTPVCGKRSGHRPEIGAAARFGVEYAAEDRDVAHALEVIAHQLDVVLAVHGFVRPFHAALLIIARGRVRCRDPGVRNSRVGLEPGRAPEVLRK